MRAVPLRVHILCGLHRCCVWQASCVWYRIVLALPQTLAGRREDSDQRSIYPDSLCTRSHCQRTAGRNGPRLPGLPSRGVHMLARGRREGTIVKNVPYTSRARVRLCSINPTWPRLRFPAVICSFLIPGSASRRPLGSEGRREVTARCVSSHP